MRRIKKKRKPSKKYAFKLSNRQSESLLNYCEINNITPNKLIKSTLKDYTEAYTNTKIGIMYVDEKQLNLFQEEAVEYEQLDIFS